MGKEGYKWVRRGINTTSTSLFYLLILEAAGGRNSGLASSSLRQEDWEPSRHTSLGKILIFEKSSKILKFFEKYWKNLENLEFLKKNLQKSFKNWRKNLFKKYQLSAPLFLQRKAPMASSSSMKTMHGALDRASSKNSRTRFAPWPTYTCCSRFGFFYTARNLQCKLCGRLGENSVGIERKNVKILAIWLKITNILHVCIWFVWKTTLLITISSKNS